MGFQLGLQLIKACFLFLKELYYYSSHRNLQKSGGTVTKKQASSKKLSTTDSLSVSTDSLIQISKYNEIYFLWQRSLPIFLSSHLWMTLCPTPLMDLYPVLLQDTDIILVLSAMRPPATAFLIILFTTSCPAQNPLSQQYMHWKKEDNSAFCILISYVKYILFVQIVSFQWQGICYHNCSLVS